MEAPPRPSTGGFGLDVSAQEPGCLPSNQRCALAPQMRQAFLRVTVQSEGGRTGSADDESQAPGEGADDAAEPVTVAVITRSRPSVSRCQAAVGVVNRDMYVNPGSRDDQALLATLRPSCRVRPLGPRRARLHGK